MWTSLAALMLAGASAADKEAALGKHLAEEFERRTTRVESPRAQQYVEDLGRKIVAQSPAANFAFTFRLVADDPCPVLHEPAALPGGYVYVPAALLLAAGDEAEFAGMVAHAVQHVTQRHGSRGAPANSGAIPLIFMGGWAGNCGSERLAVPRTFWTQLRAHELEADFLAAQVMARAGFDPSALVRYVERVQPEGALVDRERRLANLRSAMELLREGAYNPANEEFATVQGELRGLGGSRRRTPPTLRRAP